MYDIVYVGLDPRLFNIPLSRPRIYAVGTLRTVVALTRPLANLQDHIKKNASPFSGDGINFFRSDQTGPELGAYGQKSLAKYRQLFGISANVSLGTAINFDKRIFL